MDNQKQQSDAQAKIWDTEYLKKSFMSGAKPQKSVVKFAKMLKKKCKEKQMFQDSPGTLIFDGLRVLDLGCGEGKNAFYFAERGANVIGIDVSKVAVERARQAARELGLASLMTFTNGSMGEPLPYDDGSFDIILDVTSSNALSTPERSVYLAEANRVLKGGGKMLVRALCKDGDANAKTLLKEHPSYEADTYIMPETGLVERVFTRDDIMMIYSEYFTIESIEKETHYTTMEAKGGARRKYKRNFWVLHLRGIM